MKFALFLLALIPLAFAASLPESEDGLDERLSITDIINHIKHLDMSNGCVNACEENVQKFWTFLCSLACKILLPGGDPSTATII